MAQITPVSPDLVASRYAQISAGPRLMYSFDTQAGIPVDGGNPLLRTLSPFTLRLVPPSIVFPETPNAGGGVSTITNALSSTRASQSFAAGQSSSAKTQSVTAATSLYKTQQAVYAGVELGSSSQFRTVNTMADGYTALDIKAQIEAILAATPLTLLVNPSEMTTSYTALQSFTNRGRNGLIFQRWGENLPTLNFSGSTGAFIAGVNSQNTVNPLTEGAITSSRSQQTPSISGFQPSARRDSAAWQNFTSLFQFYKNNGYIYDTFGRSEAHLMVGCVQIEYDQMIYYGHIDSLNWAYTADSPFRVQWDMAFTALKVLDRAQAPSVVLPMTGPTQSPSNYPSREARGGTTSFSTSQGLDYQAAVADQIFGQTPLDLLLPEGTLL
jgi:hypothetical protein